jgi:SAM-dependent methyltransferase
MNTRTATFTLTILLFSSCQPRLFRPYKCGPVLNAEQIQVFRQVNEFIDLRPGDVYADIGASSGYYDGAMAVFLDSIDFYIQDIDPKCLSKKNLRKMVKYYSSFSEIPLEEKHRFYPVIGTETETNLPDSLFDRIYSNATYHVLNDPDAILQDIRRKLKPDGLLFIRDEFIYEGSPKLCDSKQCRHLIPRFDDFLQTMGRNGFEMAGQSESMGNYPIYRFRKSSR